jgi:hypothetical protein
MGPPSYRPVVGVFVRFRLLYKSIATIDSRDSKEDLKLVLPVSALRLVTARVICQMIF